MTKPDMYRARSDPLIIKPSANVFLLQWNEKKFEETSTYSRDTDPFYGILIRVADVDMLGDCANNLHMIERNRTTARMERHARRRNSMIQANAQVMTVSGQGRANSAPDILQLCVPSGHNPAKRVSFSMEATISPSIQADRATPPSARPILQKPRRVSDSPLTHMDYDLFAAWRRGSRLSFDLQAYKRESAAERGDIKMHHVNRRKGPLEIVKGALFNCFYRRGSRTTPVPKQF